MSSSPIPNTGVSVITDRKWSLSLFFQLLNGHIDKATHLDGVWNVGPGGQLAATPIDGSPLASITYSGGKEIRVYYLDTNYVVQEYCYSHGKGWFPGEVGNMNAKAVPGSGLAAIVYGSDVLGKGEPGVHIRVYYQQEGSNSLKELANDGYWHQGDMDVTDAIGGTSVAAVTYYFQDQTQIRVYYQSRNLSLKEHGHNNGGWFDGAFNPGQAGNRTPISAIAFGDVQLQVYWRNLDGKVVYAKNTGSWGGAIPIQIIGPGYNFAVLQWDDGKYIRLYYQLSDSVLVEFCSDDGGSTWFQGEFHTKGSA